jgi:hypothetical protein
MATPGLTANSEFYTWANGQMSLREWDVDLVFCNEDGHYRTKPEAKVLSEKTCKLKIQRQVELEKAVVGLQPSEARSKTAHLERQWKREDDATYANGLKAIEIENQKLIADRQKLRDAEAAKVQAMRDKEKFEVAMLKLKVLAMEKQVLARQTTDIQRQKRVNINSLRARR